MPFFNGETKWLQQLCKRKDSQILSQILHFLNFDLTPIYKGGFCCPLYSHASVFRFRSKLELLRLSQWCTSARQTSLEFIYIRQPCKKNNFHFLSVESIYQYLKLTYACICRKIKEKHLRRYTQRHDVFRFQVGFCCPLYSHASVFRFRSKLELLGPSMEYSFSNKPNEAPRGLWNSTFVDNYERSNYLKNFRHVCLAMIRQLVRLWVKYRLPCCCIKRGRSPTEDNLNTASTLRQVKKRGLNKWWAFCLASFLFWTVMHIG